jgi:hypothetical protein
MIPTTELYVPVKVTKQPERITKTAQQTFGNQYLELCLPFPQLSNSHMQPIGWKHIIVPSKAPIRDTKELNTGMVLAII